MSKKFNTVAVIFGSKSMEHDVSIVTAIHAMSALEGEGKKVVPIYIGENGAWFSGDSLKHKSPYIKGFDRFSDIIEIQRDIFKHENGLFYIEKKRSDSILNISFGRDKFFFDVVLIAGHGSTLEDGSIQGMFDMMNVPYSGPGQKDAALFMNKIYSYAFVKNLGFPVIEQVDFSRFENVDDASKKTEDFFKKVLKKSEEIIAKPANLGSSIGISCFQNDAKKIKKAAKDILKIDDQIVFQRKIDNMYEYNVSVARFDNKIEVSDIEMPINKSKDILTFEKKYPTSASSSNDSNNGKFSVSHLSSALDITRELNPKSLPAKHKKSIIDIAKEVYIKSGLRGVSRFDFILDKDSNKIYFSECNTIPGVFAFYLWVRSHNQTQGSFLVKLIEQSIVDADVKKVTIVTDDFKLL